MSISRLLLGCVAGAGISAAVSSACSSFSASEDSASGDAGGDTSADGGARGEAGSSGEAGTCNAPLAPLATDPQNCGKCGHSCLGGACVAGACQPVLVGTSNDEAVVDVAVGAQRVIWLTSTGFWSNSGHVFACPLGGCPDGGAAISLTGAPISTGSLAGDGTLAFYSEPYGGAQVGIRAILPSGVPQPVGMPHSEAVRLQMRNGKLYFVTLYEAGTVMGYTGHVYTWDGTTEQLVGDFASPHNLNDMVVVGARAFFSGPEFLGACPLGTPKPATCTPSDFAQTPGEYSSLTTDGTSVIWTDATNVLSCPADKPTCATPTALLGSANLGAAVRSLAYDRADLYVTTSTNDIWRCELPDCVGTLRKLVHETSRLFESSEPVWGHSLAADDTAIYWSAVDGMAVSNGDGGSVRTGVSHRVMKLAK